MRVLLLISLALLPAAVVCRSLSPFIIGGTPAADGAWPWMMSIYHGNGFSCGGAIIGPQSGVTAAHCVGGVGIAFTIFVGSNNRSCCESRIPNIHRNPDYVNSGFLGYPNDIAVLTWTLRILENTGVVEYIDLATISNDVQGQTCFMTGWGFTTVPGDTSQMLNQGQVEMISTTDCQNYYSGTGIDGVTQVCFEDTANHTVTACSGDTGGPVACQLSSSDPWTLVGVISWGEAGCNPDAPTVCTRVSYYRDWILSWQ